VTPGPLTCHDEPASGRIGGTDEKLRGGIVTDPEPATEPEPIERAAARVLLVDRDGRVLLFRGSDSTLPEAGSWWITPGGGVEEGESLAQAARREVLEETGQVLPADLGPVILTRTAEFRFEAVRYRQTESFFRVSATHSEIDYSGWTEIERRTVHTHRWWSVDELRATTETFYPEGLPDLLAEP
jgi:8-oxo-dGTP pyrophosphatase MutT (NUDIX family)